MKSRIEFCAGSNSNLLIEIYHDFIFVLTPFTFIYKVGKMNTETNFYCLKMLLGLLSIQKTAFVLIIVPMDI